ncbi:phosphoglycerate mutase family protein [Streptococcus parauberis]|nr:phosphoglycerate mutase family protein [Streptococcus parauberis]
MFNVQDRVQGACDSPLTELGIQQALQVKDYFLKNNISFDEVYSSTQERATDTARLVSEQTVVQLKGLRSGTLVHSKRNQKCFCQNQIRMLIPLKTY